MSSYATAGCVCSCGGIAVDKQIAELATLRQINRVLDAWITDLLEVHLKAYTAETFCPEYNVSSASLLDNLCTARLEMPER